MPSWLRTMIAVGATTTLLASVALVAVANSEDLFDDRVPSGGLLVLVLAGSAVRAWRWALGAPSPSDPATGGALDVAKSDPTGGD